MKKIYPVWIESLFNPRTTQILEQCNLRNGSDKENYWQERSCQEEHESIRKELLRQARISFNFAILTMGISSAVSVAGICLLFSGNLKEGAMTSTGGLASYLVPANCIKLTERTTDRIDKLLGGAQTSS